MPSNKNTTGDSRLLNICYLIAGTGSSYYCQNCVRDTTVIHQLRKVGHAVTLVPLYLPLLNDYEDQKETGPVFFGAVSTFIREQIPLFRHMPHFLEKALDSAPLLSLAARRAGSTSPVGLEQMTISMLKGVDGNERDEIERLVEWLNRQQQFDVIHISNALLIGFAETLRSALSIPIICSLQDEDSWLTEMRSPWDAEAWALIEKQAAHTDLFIAVSRWYADFFKSHITIDKNKITIMYPGVDTTGYPQYDPTSANEKNIGYLARICPQYGFDILVNAFIKLKEDPRNQDLKLTVMGGATPTDRKFLKAMIRLLKNAGCYHDVEFMYDFSRQHRLHLFEKISLLALPTRTPEAFGNQLIEAMAASVPVLAPDFGGYPEVITPSGGGILFESGNLSDFTDKLVRLVDDSKLATDLGRKGCSYINSNLSIMSTVERLTQAYTNCIKRFQKN